MRALVWHLRDAEEREHVDRALSGRRAPPVRSGRDGGGEVRRREPDQPPRAPTKPDLRTYPVADRPSSNLSKISLAPDHTKRPNQTPPANGESLPAEPRIHATHGRGRARGGGGMEFLQGQRLETTVAVAVAVVAVAAGAAYLVLRSRKPRGKPRLGRRQQPACQPRTRSPTHCPAATRQRTARGMFGAAALSLDSYFGVVDWI